MNHYYETIIKFLDALEVDSIRDVVYVCNTNCTTNCICGQAIKYGRKLRNKRNGRTCVVGGTCYGYIKDYLGWH